MPTLIYRKSDRLWVGTSHGRRTPELEAAALAAEIQNIINSDLGGTEDDYGTIIVPSVESGRVPVIAADLSVIWEKSRKQQDKESARLSAHGKLRSLGLTQEEIEAL